MAREYSRFCTKSIRDFTAIRDFTTIRDFKLICYINETLASLKFDFVYNITSSVWRNGFSVLKTTTFLVPPHFYKYNCNLVVIWPWKRSILNSPTRFANAMSDELTLILHNYSSTNNNSSQLLSGNSRDHTSFTVMPRIRRLYMSLYSLRAG
jgi:hypothetical protein